MRHRRAWLTAAISLIFLGGCAETQFVVSSVKRISGSTEATKSKQKVPGHYKVGAPYNINGTWYYPKVDFGYRETGIASWYGQQFHGKHTANGETFDMNMVSAAHRTLPLPSFVRVTNLENGRTIKVRINDRGPFARGRIIDMSRRGAQLLGFERAGTTTVRVEILERESRQVAAAYGQIFKPIKSEKPVPVAVPRVAVTSKSLAPPPGIQSAPPPTKDHTVAAVEKVPKRDLRSPSVLPSVDDTVKVVPIDDKQRLYIQVGAFSQIDNANKMRARLSSIGPASIYHVRATEHPFFRVRLGPLTNASEAESMLERINDAGIKDARIAVE